MAAGSQAVEQCFAALKAVSKLQEVSRIVDESFPIKEPHVQPIQIVLDCNREPPQQGETPFVPSTQLLKSYQQTFSRANQDQRITNTRNYKLQANFGTPAPQRNSAGGREQRGKMLEQAIIVEDREATILQQLKNGKIQATIPNMEKTLFFNELSHLQQKEVVVENTLSLSDWKKLRSRFAK